jgi:hypothetical protein
VDLPAGYRTTRRDALKFLSLGGAFGSLYVGITRAQVRSCCHRHQPPWLLPIFAARLRAEAACCLLPVGSCRLWQQQEQLQQQQQQQRPHPGCFCSASPGCGDGCCSTMFPASSSWESLPMRQLRGTTGARYCTHPHSDRRQLGTAAGLRHSAPSGCTARVHSSPAQPFPPRLPCPALPCRPHPPAPLPRTAHCLQSLSYASPKALLNALLPQAQLPESAAAGGSAARVAAFKRYIAGGLLAGRRVPAGCLCSRPGMSSVHGVQTSHLQRQGLPSSEAY